ncbi:nuclear transport factor 2 family protein, partial [Streptomyces mirabilis]|uniref:nuclear transport factor 2 family protein n=1 Tax=Streptomyces mirabilis TaxID=68239 RepID=UPI0037BC8822
SRWPYSFPRAPHQAAHQHESVNDQELQLPGQISSIQHDIPGLTVISSGNYVVTEGSVRGTTKSGAAFPDGKSSYGLFCNVFEFEDERIKRLHIYEDPDFASTHTDAINWGESVRDSM